MNISSLGGAAFAVSALLLSAQPALAAAPTQSTDGPTQSAETRAPRLSVGEIAARVEQQGYRDIEEIEREGSAYEVCAEDASGREVELTVNGSTGRVEKVEPCED